MDLTSGFPLENPAIFVPSRVKEADFRNLLPAASEVTRGYYVLTRCTSLGGLVHDLGFHFAPPLNGRLHELEFFSFAFPDLDTSFRSFQQHLEAMFGPPTDQAQGDGGFPHYSWRQMPGVEVVHLVFDRFGPEEHVRIRW